jgi:alcohol dehydrogenase class IV
MLLFEIMNRFPAQVIFGSETVQLLADKIAGFDGKKILLLTDQGILKAGIADKVKGCLSGEVGIYAELKNEPKSDEVQQALEVCRTGKYDMVIGVGGGSVLDTAKIVATLNNSSKKVTEVYGNEKVGKRITTLVLIPTTAGTGSEATPNALVFDKETGNKEAIISSQFIPDWVVLDPALTQGLPLKIAAATGMDALCHCIESYISCNGNEVSSAYAFKGLELLGENLGQIAAKNTPEIRGNMLLGSFFGGLALTIAGTTAVHALSYPLGKRGVPHGVANGMLLASVLEYNFPAIETQLNRAAGLFKENGRVAENGRDLIVMIANYVKSFPVPRTLKDVGIDPQLIPELAKEALTNERLMKNNPRHLSQAEAENIYRSIQ